MVPTPSMSLAPTKSTHKNQDPRDYRVVSNVPNIKWNKEHSESWLSMSWCRFKRTCKIVNFCLILESDDRGMTRRVSSCFLTPKTFVRSLKVSWSQKSLTFAIKPLVRLAVWKIVSHLRENWMLCLLRERTSDSCTSNAERCTFNQTKGPVGSVFFSERRCAVCCE